MKRILYLVLVLVALFVVPAQTSTVRAERLAQCDVCGYCQGSKVPGTWKACRICMYEALGNVEASSNKTLIVDENPKSQYYNLQVTPKPGRYFTQIGCISTQIGASDFTGQGAAGNVVARILGIIFNVSGGIAFIYLIIGAYTVISSRNDPQAIARGKSIIVGAIVGLIFVMTITLTLNLIGNGILKIPGFGN